MWRFVGNVNSYRHLSIKYFPNYAFLLKDFFKIVRLLLALKINNSSKLFCTKLKLYFHFYRKERVKGGSQRVKSNQEIDL